MLLQIIVSLQVCMGLRSGSRHPPHLLYVLSWFQPVNSSYTQVMSYTPATFSFGLTDLRPSVVYHFSASCQDNQQMTYQSEWMNFTTLSGQSERSCNDILKVFEQINVLCYRDQSVFLDSSFTLTWYQQYKQSQYVGTSVGIRTNDTDATSCHVNIFGLAVQLNILVLIIIYCCFLWQHVQYDIVQYNTVAVM